jgi:hypothetical protein
VWAIAGRLDGGPLVQWRAVVHHGLTPFERRRVNALGDHAHAFDLQWHAAFADDCSLNLATVGKSRVASNSAHSLRMHF